MTTKINSVHVLCGHCNTRFESPIFIGTIEAFETLMTSGNKVFCPNCHTPIQCNKENMSYVLEGSIGGSVGEAYGGNKEP